MPSETRKLERWQRGPEFLWQNVEAWPKQPPDVSEDLLESDEGVKQEKVTVGAATVNTDFWDTVSEVFDLESTEKSSCLANQSSTCSSEVSVPR